MWHHHLDPDEGPVHVWPDDDAIEHDLDSEDCVCGPMIEYYLFHDRPDATVIIHYALDRRLEDCDAEG